MGSSPDPLSGRRVGEFILREKIGEGGFAAVYRCDQPALGREAVVKVLHPRLTSRQGVLERFLREARLASRLDHPYAAHVYAFGVEEQQGLFWIAMEMVYGTALDAWLRDRGPLPLDQFVPFFERVAEVVQTAHERGIIHRDLKPSNIMIVERAGQLLPKLLDFGIAKMLDLSPTPASMTTPSADPEQALSNTITLESTADRADTLLPATRPIGRAWTRDLTQTHATLGSPPYISPEQWYDAPRVGPATDLYSLGIIAFEALTGRRPFVADSISALAQLHLAAPVPGLGKGFPPELDRLFQRALAKHPLDRPASALELALLLRAASGVGPARDASVQRATRRPSPARWLAIGSAAALVTGGAALAVLRNPSDGGAIGRPAPQRAMAPVPDAGVPGSAAPPIADPPPPPEPKAEPAQVSVRQVSVRIESSPSHADVFRLPSETRVGQTPWQGFLPAEDGHAVFVVRKRRFADRRIEVDLRSGGVASVKLAPVPARRPVERRRKGEPADPFQRERR